MKLSALLPGALLDAVAGGVDNSSWKKRAFYVFLLGLLAWGAAFSFWSDVSDLRMRRVLQRNRFNDLVSVLREYSALKAASASPGGEAIEPVSDGELLTVVSNVVSDLGLRRSQGVPPDQAAFLRLFPRRSPGSFPVGFLASERRLGGAAGSAFEPGLFRVGRGLVMRSAASAAAACIPGRTCW